MGPVAVGPPATRVQGDGVMINHTPGVIPDVMVAITDAERAEAALEAYYKERGLSRFSAENHVRRAPGRAAWARAHLSAME